MGSFHLQEERQWQIPRTIKDPGQTSTVPTDKGEDSEERRDAAEQAWRDKQGVPRGTPEQGERSADRVGGDGPAQPEPKIDDVDEQADKRRASTEDETEAD